ncbi:malate dehydrogenase [Ophiostoma piceae UAMH 11346]|uniref:Malate dehydrogenase n=1 Tax=Ophiostoma piceae (strain UAMH 11346) TaxID=1262450 RepID=S3C9V9_OPHP1|nr:malate dehydrogenase [Ophiostoma piceae UAMH 11346]
MHTSSLLLATLASVSTVMGSPAFPELTHNNAIAGAVDTVSNYFNLLAEKVQATRQSAGASTCDLSKAVWPANNVTPALPPPSDGLVLKHVAIGRGTQNYTCDLTNATAIPVQVGALATLFNASCVAASYPDVLDMLPRVVMPFNLTDNDISVFSARLYPTNLDVSGHHFFETTTTPFFNLTTPSSQLGQVPCAKNATQAAPNNTVAGSDADNRGQLGEKAVPWLKLSAKPGATGGLQEVYRLQTIGGSAPATCSGQAASFTIEYAAQYWFYEST